MKANKAPDKIYINPMPNPSDGYVGVAWSEPHIDMKEYTRTDAFIEKATLWLLTNASDYCILHNSYDTEELVKDFVDAMKRD